MTERQRIEKMYEKVRSKNPDVTDSVVLEELAIKADKSRTLLEAFAWLLGGIACGVILMLFLTDSGEAVRLIFLMMTGSGIFEFFRTLGKFGKIEKRYRPVASVHYEGQLDGAVISKHGGKKLKKAENRYIIVRGTLADKNDELDTGTDNETHHTYSLYFECGKRYELNVKRNVYLDAVLGTEYFLVLTADSYSLPVDIVAAFQANNWSLAEELRAVYQGDDFDLHNSNVKELEKTAPDRKTAKKLSILAMVFSVIALFINVLFGLPLAVAAVILASVSVAKCRYKLSVTGLVISILSLVLNIVYLIAILAL